MTSTLILLRHGESLWNLENRFTGWVDVPLTFRGQLEAIRAGRLLKNANIIPEVVCSSVLTRCIHSTWQVLDQLDCSWLPVEKTWRLNERHYGSLQGLNKDETARKLGEAQVQYWRKSFKGIPPPDFDAPGILHREPRYRRIALSDLPSGESLEMTIRRIMPWWEHFVVPHLLCGKTVLIVAHRNSLRALIMFINQMDDEAVVHLKIPTGEPMIYQMKDGVKVISYEMLSGENLEMKA